MIRFDYIHPVILNSTLFYLTSLYSTLSHLITPYLISICTNLFYSTQLCFLCLSIFLALIPHHVIPCHTISHHIASNHIMMLDVMCHTYHHHSSFSLSSSSSPFPSHSPSSTSSFSSYSSPSSSSFT